MIGFFQFDPSQTELLKNRNVLIEAFRAVDPQPGRNPKFGLLPNSPPSDKSAAIFRDWVRISEG